MASVKALITPKVITWARECSGFSIAEVATKLKRSAEEITAWESGTDSPSIPQARVLSELYRRPLAVFYMPEPPEGFQTLPDFRRLDSAQERTLSIELIDVIRTVQSHQSWTHDYLIAEGERALDFIGKSKPTDRIVLAANSIREELNIDINWQEKRKIRQEAFNYWLAKVEHNRIFVIRKGGIKLSECRGFAITDNIAPFIYINTDDGLAAQLFSLVHELAHIWINESGISNLGVAGSFLTKKSSSVEKFCNAVASEVLVPVNIFRDVVAKIDQDEKIEKKVERLSKTFCVSEEVIARKMLDLGLISSQLYEKLRDFYNNRWLEYKAIEDKRRKEKKGGPSYYTTMISYNGLAYTQMLIGAYTGGRVSGRDASAMLNVKVNHFNKLSGRANELYSSRLNAMTLK